MRPGFARGHPSRRAPERAPQRLSCESSVLPWTIISQDGVENGEQLSGDGDQGNHFWLTKVKKVLVEVFEWRVVASGDEGGQERGRSNGGTTTSDHAFAAPAAGLAGIRGKASQTWCP